MSTWVQRLVEGDFLNDEIKWGTGRIPKLEPSRLSEKMKDFLIET